jgi:2-amino-4-hydroxy-6-hydroxymethyldihydropteridine diphosphokinase
MSASRWCPAYVGIGSNLESPERQVRNAIDLLEALPDARLVSVSGLYQSAPLCGQKQPDYINAVAALLTQQNAPEFLQQLQVLEQKQGRIRSEKRWAARVLDLDLLAFSKTVLADGDLTLPHPGIADRNFVLLPWNEIAPDFVVPGLGRIRDLAARISRTDPAITRL